MIFEFSGQTPEFGTGVIVLPGATVIGRVSLGAESSVWFGAVLRGDVEEIRVGPRTNLQDRVVVQVATETGATIVGADVTIGHAAVLHGCRVGDLCLVGIGAILLDGSELGEESILGAGSLVPPGTRLAPGHLHLGNPVRTIRPLRPEERQHLRDSAARYVHLAKRYREIAINPVLEPAVSPTR